VGEKMAYSDEINVGFLVAHEAQIGEIEAILRDSIVAVTSTLPA